jgi:hypothetical protein
MSRLALHLPLSSCSGRFSLFAPVAVTLTPGEGGFAMRTHHKIVVAVAVIIVLLLALLLPRKGHADQTAEFGDVVVRYSAITTDQLFPAVAQSYGIERSSRNGLVNIAVEKKGSADTGQMIAAVVTGKVADLTGHSRPIRFRETNEGGAVDYLGEFPIDASGTYVFTINVSKAGQATPYTVKFNRDYVAD